MMAGCSHLQTARLSKGIVLASRRSGRSVLAVALDSRHTWVLTVNLGLEFLSVQISATNSDISCNRDGYNRCYFNTHFVRYTLAHSLLLRAFTDHEKDEHNSVDNRAAPNSNCHHNGYDRRRFNTHYVSYSRMHSPFQSAIC